MQIAEVISNIPNTVKASAVTLTSYGIERAITVDDIDSWVIWGFTWPALLKLFAGIGAIAGSVYVISKLVIGTVTAIRTVRNFVLDKKLDS